MEIPELLKNGTANAAITWLFRIGLLTLIFWIKGNFVSQEKYDADQAKRLQDWIDVGKNIQHLDDSLSTFQLQFTELNDHELRIRGLEATNRKKNEKPN